MLSQAAFAADKARVKAALAAGLLDPDEAAEQISLLLKRVNLGGDSGAGGGCGGAGGAGSGVGRGGGGGGSSSGATGGSSNLGEVIKATRTALGELKSRKLGKQLARACRDLRPNDAIQLIKEGADVDYGYERRPLHSASYFVGMEAVAALLIEAGANVNAVDSSGETPLFNAAYSGHLATAKLLLMHMDRTSINVVQKGQTALDVALKDDEFDDDGDRRDPELFAQIAAAIRSRGGLTAAELSK